MSEVVEANMSQTVSLQNFAKVLCYRVGIEDRSHTEVKMESIVDLLVYYFVQNKNDDYQGILSDLRRISETK